MRTPAGHRGPHRADGGPVLPGEMPRPALPGIRARRRGRGARERRHLAGALQLRTRSACVRRRSSCARRGRNRLDGEFEQAYQYAEPLFGGENPYLDAIDRNMEYLQRILRAERWRLLRRNPPLFTSPGAELGQVRGLMVDRLEGDTCLGSRANRCARHSARATPRAARAQRPCPQAAPRATPRAGRQHAARAAPVRRAGRN